MKIDVLQIQSEGKNEFEIKYNDTLQYKAKLPFISIKEPLNLEKLRSIKIFDINENDIYTTDYKYSVGLNRKYNIELNAMTESQFIQYGKLTLLSK